jgi:recombinational DNA repair protein (RecF pathway)
MRQPNEFLFSWINEKTGIQQASKVRSYQGLLVYAFGRLAAAVLLLAINP